MHLLATDQPQLVLADINGQTLGLLDAVRAGEGLAGEIDPHTPMIVLTSRADELERVRVFDRGGDDVVAKPFSYPELRARIRALLRRPERPPRVSPRRRADDRPLRARSRSASTRRAGGQGVRAAARARRANRPACSPARSCCAMCGAQRGGAHPHAGQRTLSPARIWPSSMWVAGSVRPVDDALSPAVWLAPSPRG